MHFEIPLHCMEQNDSTTTQQSPTSEDDYVAHLLSMSPSDVGCYDNPKHDEQEQFLRYEAIVGGYCNIVLGIVGVIGNILSIIVLGRQDMQTNNCFNKLLIGLVASDSMHIVFGVMESLRSSFPSLYPSKLLLAFPWFHFPFYRITLCASIYMVIAVAIERYLAVCFPHDYRSMRGNRNRAWYYILPAIFTAFLVNVPRFFETEARENIYWTENCTQSAGVEVAPTDLRLNRTYIIIYVNWVWTITTGIIPFAALLLLNVKIFLGLQKVQKNLNRHQRLANACERRNNNQQPEVDNNDIPLVTLNNGNETENANPGEIEDETTTMVTTLISTNARKSSSTNNGNTISVVNGNEGNLDSRSRPPSLRQRARTAAQRKLMSAAQSREANMAVILVCTVTMFLLCHLPRLFIVVFEASTVNRNLDCREKGFFGFPMWFLYVPPVVRILQVFNASINFPIYYFMGHSFRNALHSMIKGTN